MSIAKHRKAVNHLRRVDPVIARVMDAVGPCRLEVRSEGDHLGALVRAIVYQQLSGKAAATIHSRVLALYGSEHPTARMLLDTSDADLRGAGLSRQKISYIRDLALHAETGTLPLDRLAGLDDAEVEAALVGVKGVGRWTAQMFLLFRLGRPNVLPDGDLGIRKGVQLAYRLRKLPTPARVSKIGAPWSPYASVASWYLWRLLELP